MGHTERQALGHRFTTGATLPEGYKLHSHSDQNPKRLVFQVRRFEMPALGGYTRVSQEALDDHGEVAAEQALTYLLGYVNDGTLRRCHADATSPDLSGRVSTGWHRAS